MKCFLAGSKELSVQVLEELIAQGHEVVGVLSRDHEKGMQVWLKELGHRSIKQRAEELGIKVFEKISINSDEFLKILSDFQPDVIFSVFWGEIFKLPVLTLSKLGCINLHTAYLPHNRGTFPMAWAIIDGKQQAGFTIHQMSKGIDSGDIIAQVKVDITDNDTGKSLYEKVTEAGFLLFQSTLPQIANKTFQLTPQKKEEGSYHPRGYPYGGQINPYWDEKLKERYIRALTFPPFEGFSPEPKPFFNNYSNPSLRIMIGFYIDTNADTSELISNYKSEDINNLIESKIQHTIFTPKTKSDSDIQDDKYFLPSNCFNDISKEYKLLDTLLRNNVNYVVMDIPDYFPHIKHQPSRFENGLLHIPVYCVSDLNIDIETLLRKSLLLANQNNRDYFLGLLFPYSSALENLNIFLKKLQQLVSNLNGSFHLYKDVYRHYLQNT